MIRAPRRPVYLSSAALVVANLIPLVGVLAGGWRVYDVLVLFWAENVIIGLYNVVKLLAVGAVRGERGAFPLAAFFTVHYGIFAAVHGAFVFTLFGPAGGEPEQMARAVVSDASLFVPLAALVLSHGVSFVANFLVGGEIGRVRTGQLMAAPYARVVVLHVTLIFGGFAVAAAGAPVAALALLVALKIVVDLAAHVAEHRGLMPERLPAGA